MTTPVGSTTWIRDELSSFVGREQQVEALRRHAAEHRLVTLVGVGGIGKTRLAVHVAGLLQGAFAQGAHVVELAGIPDESAVDVQVASALGLRNTSASPVADQIVEHLMDRELLLVVDNCEHVLAACAALLERILRSCPSIRCLATSRISLGLAGEHLFSVPPLSVDPVNGGALTEAGRLLVDRVRQFDPDFSVTQANQQAIASICTRLDGLPLAIELAASRLRTLGVDQLAERLTDPFAVLVNPVPAHAPRQQTLRALIDWSHGLCSPGERCLWARLSVFAGTFAIDSVEDVCSDEGGAYDGSSRVGGRPTIDLLDGLVRSSLVTVHRSGGTVRYSMLETIRRYGLERLGGDEERRVRERHRDHYLSLVEDGCATWVGPHQAATLLSMRTEQHNLRAALEFCATDGGDGTQFLRLTAALRYHWYVNGFIGEGRYWLDRAVAAGRTESAERVDALWVAAWVSVMQGDHDAAASRLTECEAAAEVNGTTHAQIMVTQLQGSSALFRGDLHDAVAYFEAARLAHHDSGSTGEELSMLFQLGMALSLMGRSDEARATCRSALALADTVGEGWGRSHAGWVLAFELWRGGEIEESEALARECLRTKLSLTDFVGCALIVELLAWIACAERRYVAAALLGAAEATWQQVGTTIAVFGPGLAAEHDRAEAATVAVVGAEEMRTAYLRAARLPVHEAIQAVSFGSEQGTAERPGGLTAGEWRIARLIQQGLTSKQIAARLVVSPRTVDSHVEHIRTRLGMGTRMEIAAWVTRQEPADAT